MVSTSYITEQSLGKIIQLAPVENVAFVFLHLSCSSSRALFVRGALGLNKHCIAVYGSHDIKQHCPVTLFAVHHSPNDRLLRMGIKQAYSPTFGQWLK